MKRALSVLIALIVIGGGLIWWLLGTQQADPTYAPQLPLRTWRAVGPAVAIDDAHWNLHTAKRGYAPFAKLLVADGYQVVDHGNAASERVLESARVVVIANALGLRGVVRQLGQIAGLRLDALAADAFEVRETERLETWVREGGSLLLVADHSPAGRAVQSVARLFDVTMHDGFVADPDNSDRGVPASIVFSRATGTLGPHEIVDGYGSIGPINRVVTFGGQALEGPRHAGVLLRFSGTAFEAPRRNARANERTPVRGLAQALALSHGRGRLVVLGEAAVLTSQVMAGGGETRRIGLAWPDCDNERFARRIMAWLSHAGE